MDKTRNKKVNYMTVWLSTVDGEKLYFILCLLLIFCLVKEKLLFNRRKSIMEKVFSLYFHRHQAPTPCEHLSATEQAKSNFLLLLYDYCYYFLCCY